MDHFSSLPCAARCVRWAILLTVIGFVLAGGIGSPAKADVLSGPTVASLTLKPSTIQGGSGAASLGTLTLNAPAPAGGQVVLLSSDTPGLAAVPPSVTVPGGQTSVTFTVWTNAKYRDYSGLSFSPQISASANSITTSATLTVTAQKRPADIQNDTADRYGDACGGSFPASSGEKGILYTCFVGPTPGTVGHCTFKQECLVSGCEPQSAHGGFQFADVCGTGSPYPISESPSAVVGASRATGTVTSDAPAPAGGSMTTIEDPLYCVTAPFNVTIPQGSTSANFGISNSDTSTAHFVGLGVLIPGATLVAAKLGLSWYAVLPSGNCKPDTCAAHGYNCGEFPDSCCGMINCGTCSAPNTCGGGGTVGVCGCTPMTCASQGFSCGSVPDGCGGTLNCGTCPSGQVCNIYNQCGFPCVPSSCAQVGANCGQTGDGCGGIIDCGTCPAGETCNSIICIPSCSPTTCQALGYTCGTASDGCGGTLKCGNCGHHQTCVNNVCSAHP